MRAYCISPFISTRVINRFDISHFKEDLQLNNATSEMKTNGMIYNSKRLILDKYKWRYLNLSGQCKLSV